MYNYKIYGLNIKSNIKIDFLTQTRNIKHIDIVIENSIDSSSFIIEKEINKCVSHNKENNILLDIPNIARYEITDEKIIIFPYYGIDNQTIINFLISSALPYFLTKKGKILLKGCGFTKDEKTADLILGYSGVGKSTILAALCKKEYEILADQFCVLSLENNKVYIEPAFPKIKLWLQATRLLKINIHELKKVRPNLKRYYWKAPFYKNKLEIKNIFKINEQNLEDKNSIEKIIGVKKINLLQNFIFGSELNELYKKNKVNTAKIIFPLASQTNFFKILNIRGKTTIKDLVKLIESKENEEK
ncbi:serine/threonine protein kinase [Francisella frigiditurris]|uniref:HPr kinase/phosphorylase C-terminal domain-containing protein n=1 Tax=Francisella frigiditurris TaxID=1542390 RepID=A0A1J0KVJ2_9GAMM|nr:serine/threonine protein kinase [Francisella frigiditurris]APC97715.1 hypothetical protein KX01_488 [Francisella frigiditurris]